MSKFIQIHLLTAYPPSNLNRDDLGRPKTAVMGTALRLRVSSQSLKRAWRTSSVFAEQLRGHLGTRTKCMGLKVYEDQINGGVPDKKALKWAAEIAGVFGKLKKNGLEIEQLAHFAPEECAAIDALVTRLVQSGEPPTKEDLTLLRKEHSAADVAMFGRMLADVPAFNTEAAVQVAHAITVNEVAVEDDYFTAVDDLNSGEEDMGAGHVGEAEFAAGLFYLYICIDRELLAKNLGDEVLAGQAIRALVQAAATVAPRGKQNSFASRAYASYLLAEKGGAQPRSLSVAFLKPLRDRDLLAAAVEALREARKKMDAAYAACDPEAREMDVTAGKGTLKDVLDYVAG